MSTRSFWARVLTATALAASLGIMLSPPRPRPRLPNALAAALGAAAGAVLYVAVTRRPPACLRSRTATATVGKQLFLGLCAANEEVLWRRVLLGELLPTGGLAALVVSSAGFAAAHRRGRLLHAGTGSAFGGLYLATGFLGASIAAHWVYNVFVGSLLERGPPP
jgi:membrane protease YdiL (CAAX protease family)